MSTELKARRDTAANIAAVTPAEGEFGFDTTNKRAIVGDGVRQGAFPIPTIRDAQRQIGIFLTVTGDGSPVNLNVLNGSTGAANDGLSAGAYAAGQKFGFFPPGENTGAVTLNIDSLGAKAIQREGSALSGGELIAARYVEVVYDGTQFQLLSSGGGVLVPLASADASNDASVDFTGLDATYDQYQIHFSGLNFGADRNLFIRLRESGSGSFASGASDYAYAHQRVTTGAVTLESSSGAAQIVAATFIGGASGENANGIIELFNPASTTLTKLLFYRIVLESSAGQPTHAIGNGAYGGGFSTAIDGIQLLNTLSNIQTGHFDLYGVARAN